MRIHVTAEDIQAGARWDPRGCPIARAIQRELPELEDAAVTGLYIRLTDNDGSDACFAAPPSVSNFARDFDIGEPVAPFEFELDLASPGTVAKVMECEFA